MISYLINSGGCLLLLLAVYHLLLEKAKMLRFNRAWLLAGLLFSFAIPFLPLPLHLAPALTIPALHQPELTAPVQPADAAHITTTTVQDTPAHLNWPLIAYGLVTAFLLLRFCRNLYLVLHRISSHPQIRLHKARLVMLQEKYIPHTFGNAVFLNENDYREHKIDPEILEHELAHVHQWHTVDIIVVEVLRIFFWFNPLLLLYKRAMQLNHEFLADEAVISTGHHPREYQELLFRLVSLANPSPLSSPLNYNITKKRLIMITKNIPQNGWARKIATVPVLLAAIILFSTSTNAQKAGGAAYPDRMIAGTELLGANPYVLINNKPYPADILTKISPRCIASSSIIGDKETAESKYGPSAADGAVVLTLVETGLTYATTIERQNLALVRSANNRFYYRLRLKRDDGTPFDRLVMNFNNGQCSDDDKADCKVAFVIDNQLYTESQLNELQARIKTMKLEVSGVGKLRKPIPGLDLSGYDVTFFFFSKDYKSYVGR